MAQGKKFIPTGEDRETVERLRACALTNDQIAYVLGIDRNTLEKNFAAELKDGKGKIDALVSGKLMQKIKEGNVPCILFYLKTRCGWRETLDINTDLVIPALNKKVLKKTDD